MTTQPEISRVIRSKQQAKTAYDRLSRWYDWFSEGSEWPLTALGLNKLNVKAGEAVLEIGFGTGNALLVLAEVVGNSGKVVGLDLSRGMFAIAREKVAHASLSQRVNLQQGDAAALPFRDNSFDAVFSSFTLELFDTPEIPTVLAECRRVLKPNRRMGVLAMARDPDEELPVRIYEWFHQHLPAYVDCRPIYVQSVLVPAGFQVQNVTRKTMWGLPMEICIAQVNL